MAWTVGACLALGACTNTSQVLEPSALVNPEADAAQQPAFPLDAAVNAPSEVLPQASASTSPPTMAAIRSDARVQFAPAIGAPPDASSSLAARIVTRANERGLTVIGTNDNSATLVMKGYFSAISDDGETTVIYVWDVLDPAGTRVHRIQGQARAPATTGEGWFGVQGPTMEAIADQTVDQLASWLTTRQG